MAKTDRLQVSAAELAVLRVLWNKGSASLGEVHRELADRYAYTTVQTMLDRLVQKGLVRRDRSRRPALHRAAVSRSRVVRHFFRMLLEHVSDGPAPLVLQLLRQEKFSEDELAAIRREIDRRKAEDRGKRK